LSGTSWESFVTNPPPPAHVLTARSSTEVFAGDSSGLAQLSPQGDRWMTPPGVGPLDVRGLWQAPSGVLFIISFVQTAPVPSCTGQTTIWRYDGSHLMRDFDVTSACGNSDIRGRTETDVYASVGRNVYHWNGSSWAPLAAPACLLDDVSTLAPIGTKSVAVRCLSTTDHQVYAYDGSSWSGVGSPYSLGSIGPIGNPTAYAIAQFVFPPAGGVYIAGNDTGWVSANFPAGFEPHGLRGPDATHLVAWGGNYGFAKTDGVSAWSTTTNWITASSIERADVVVLEGNLQRFWSDGRWVVSASDTKCAPCSQPMGYNHNAVGRCDLGP